MFMPDRLGPANRTSSAFLHPRLQGIAKSYSRHCGKARKWIRDLFEQCRNFAQSRRARALRRTPVRIDEKGMLSAKDLKSNDGANGSAAQVPADFPISEISGLNSLKLTRLYPRNSVLFVEGQLSRGVHVLHSGRAKVSITSAEGKTLVLRVAQPVDLLGINATLTGRPYGATVETLEPCRIDFIPASLS